jgi:hypothetical protein
MKTYQLLALGAMTILSIQACKKDKDEVATPAPPANESEVITTLRITFTDSANTADVRTAEFRDPDGPGGVAYDRFDTIRLDSNRTYFATILLLNETASPVDTISNEVLEEADDHLFCFTPSGTSATITVTDRDGNNLPIGLQSTWRTTSAGSGAMTVSLHHQPGIKNGDCALGETDVEVRFVTKID